MWRASVPDATSEGQHSQNDLVCCVCGELCVFLALSCATCWLPSQWIPLILSLSRSASPVYPYSPVVISPPPPPPPLSLQSLLPDGCPFYPLFSRKIQLDSTPPSSPRSPLSPSIKSIFTKSHSSHPPSSPASSAPLTSGPAYSEYEAVFLGRLDRLSDPPNQSLINDVIARVLATPTDPCDLVVRVGSADVALLAEKKTRLLGEFPYNSLCGCGQGTTHQTCFTIVSVHMATGQTCFTCFVCEAVSSELANFICKQIAQGFSGEKT